MGRASNRKKARRAETAADADKLRIIVCTYADQSLAPVADLIKAAVLYGDEVLLHSPTALLLASVATLGNLSSAELVSVLHEHAPSLGGTEFARQMDEREGALGKEGANLVVASLLDSSSAMRNLISALDPTAAIELGRYAAQLDEARQELSRVVEEQLTVAGVSTITPAIEAGVLQLAPIDRTDDLFEGYIEKLWSVLRDSRYYPVFDAGIADLVSAAVKEGMITPSDHIRSRGKQVGAAGGFLARLPTFPRASMDEVVDIRSELDRPLVRFRAEMINVGREFSVEAYDRDFDAAAEEAWISRVKPALLELDELVEEKRLRTLFAAGLSTSGVVGAAGGLLAGIITHAPLIAAGVGAGSTLLAGAAGIASDKSKLERDLRKRPFYFLHKTENLLSASIPADREGKPVSVSWADSGASHLSTILETQNTEASDTRAVRITQAEYGDRWPFTIVAGTLRCEGASAVLFDDDNGNTYALNGTARTLRQFANVEDIWRDDPNMAGLKVNLGTIIDRGLKLCSSGQVGQR